MTHTTTVGIVGGGLGGLALLATLTRRGIPAKLFERDPSFEARAHLGGFLDMHWESGQRCLRENGLEAGFRKYLADEQEGMRIYNLKGDLLCEDDGPPGPPPGDTGGNDLEHRRPEIDRTVLRRLLLDACNPADVRWGYGLKSISAAGSAGQHDLAFSNGQTFSCDLVVGADGAHSRVRPLLSPAVAEYSGINGVELSIPADVLQSGQGKEIVEKLSPGMTFILGDQKFVGTHSNPDGRVRAYLWFPGPESWTVPADPSDAKKQLHERFARFNEWTTRMISLADEAALYHRPLYSLPIGHYWTHAKGVTLLGDAAHLMTPFAGEGANLAMLDGLELGYAIADGIKSGDVDAAVATFETEMCERASVAAQESRDNMVLMTSHDDSAERTADWFKSHGPPPS